MPGSSPVRLLLAAGGLILAAGLAACGGGEHPAQPAGSTLVTMTDYAFSPKDLTVAGGGPAVIYLVNAGGQPHDLVIRDQSGRVLAKSKLVSAGGAAVFTISTLAPGSYKTICDVAGHEALGMKGTLTIT